MKSICKGIRVTIMIMVASLAYQACEKDLEPEIFDQISPSNFFKSRNDVNAAVIGIYTELAKNVEEPVIMGEYGTDEYRNNAGGGEQINDFDWNESSFGGMYNLRVPAVTRAGALIEVVTDLAFLEKADKDQILGELRTLRAIFMFDLLRWYLLAG